MPLTLIQYLLLSQARSLLHNWHDSRRDTEFDSVGRLGNDSSSRRFRLVRFGPRKDIVEIAALMHRVEVWIRAAAPSNPVVREYAYISITHQFLTEQVRAMICPSELQHGRTRWCRRYSLPICFLRVGGLSTHVGPPFLR